MVYSSFYFDIIKNYFNFLHIQSVVMIICPEEALKVNVLKEMSSQSFLLSFSVNSIQDNPIIRTGNVLDISCPNTSVILQKMSARKMFNSDMEWLMLEEVNTTDSFEITAKNDALKNTLALPGSCVTLAQISENEKRVKLYEVYRTAMWEPMKYKFLEEYFLNGSTKFTFRRGYRKFEGVILRSASAIFYPELFLGWESQENKEVDTISKAAFAFMNDIADHLNYSFTLKFLNFYGYETNGSFNGVVGYLQREEIDMSANGLMMNVDRMPYVDFVGDILVLRSPLIFRQPALSSVSNLFVLPFHQTVWILIVVVTMLYSMVLFLNLFLKMRLFRLKETDDTSVLEILTVIMAYVCGQGTGLELKPGAGRITLCILSMFCFFLSVSFSAKIVALLHSSAHTIKSLPDLTRSPMAVGIQNVVYNKHFFSISKDKEVRELFQKKILPQGDKAIIKPDVGIQKVKEGLYAYKVETPWAYTLITRTFEDKEKCDLDELNPFVMPTLAVGLQEKSGYREPIARSFSRLSEVGIKRRTMNLYYPQKPFCNLHNIGYSSVKLTDFKPALDFVSYGLALSLILFLFELLSKTRYLVRRILKS
nr:ionotropic receptor 75c [Graphosoma rubrolineatum]